MAGCVGGPLSRIMAKQFVGFQWTSYSALANGLLSSANYLAIYHAGRCEAISEVLQGDEAALTEHGLQCC